MQKKLLILLSMLLLATSSFSAVKSSITVDKSGHGDFKTIQEAIESLPMYCYDRVTIYIKNGVYNEKIRINRDYLTLIGESRENTRIEYSQLREDWIADEDEIGPAVVNIFADDIVIKNLTIENTQPEIGPHAFAIYGTGTRTILLNCTVLSKGGDTVSLWDYKTGMYYHDQCYFQGAVDFVCPRGWCYISNSTFYELKNTAAVWHAAPTNPNQKLVLESCQFEGADSFYIARHHYDAQFFFLNCTFPELMRNKPIEHVVYKDNPGKNRPYLHGNRYYFSNCNRIGGDYSWFADNHEIWPKQASPKIINPEWTFDGHWNPLDSSQLEILKVEVNDKHVFLWFDEKVMPLGHVKLKTTTGKELNYYHGTGRERMEFKSEEALVKNDFKDPLLLLSGNIQAIKAYSIPKLFIIE